VKNEIIVKLDKKIIDKLNVVASQEKLNLNNLIEAILEKSIPEKIDK
tara:strand:+ start:664 stop:804 length:141 start_codon:yes stop_codon:yes gene_type:complete